MNVVLEIMAVKVRRKRDHSGKENVGVPGPRWLGLVEFIRNRFP